MLRDTILVIENDEISRGKLAEIFRDKYKMLEVSNEKEGVEAFRKNAFSIAIVLINLLIPSKNNFQILQWLSEHKFLDRIPFIMLTSEEAAEYEKRGYECGIVGYIRKPFSADEVKQFVENIISVFEYKQKLEVMVKEQARQLQEQKSRLMQMKEKQERMSETLVETLSNVVEFRNLESEQHIKRVRELSLCLGNSVMNLYPEYELTEEKINILAGAAALHDIGKIVIPDHIILKAGKLTPDEFEVLKSHTTKGAELIEKAVHLDNKEFCDYAYDIARHHHERYDGKGYPDGLNGEEISIAAQIVSLVDAYDELTSKKIYKSAYKADKSYQIIVNDQRDFFSPKLLKAFGEVREQFEEIVKNIVITDSL